MIFQKEGENISVCVTDVTKYQEIAIYDTPLTMPQPLIIICGSSLLVVQPVLPSDNDNLVIETHVEVK